MNGPPDPDWRDDADYDQDVMREAAFWMDKEADAKANDDPRCPECHSIDINQHHHEGNALAPECTFWLCWDCDHQWGHE